MGIEYESKLQTHKLTLSQTGVLVCVVFPKEGLDLIYSRNLSRSSL